MYVCVSRVWRSADRRMGLGKRWECWGGGGSKQREALCRTSKGQWVSLTTGTTGICAMQGGFFDHAPKGDRRALSSFEQKNPPYGKKVCQSHLRVIALPSKSGEYQKNPPCIAQIPVYWSLLILLSFARSILVPSGLSVPSWSLPFSGPCCTCWVLLLLSCAYTFVERFTIVILCSKKQEKNICVMCCVFGHRTRIWIYYNCEKQTRLC